MHKLKCIVKNQNEKVEIYRQKIKMNKLKFINKKLKFI